MPEENSGNFHFNPHTGKGSRYPAKIKCRLKGEDGESVPHFQSAEDMNQYIEKKSAEEVGQHSKFSAKKKNSVIAKNSSNAEKRKEVKNNLINANQELLDHYHDLELKKKAGDSSAYNLNPKTSELNDKVDKLREELRSVSVSDNRDNYLVKGEGNSYQLRLPNPKDLNEDSLKTTMNQMNEVWKDNPNAEIVVPHIKEPLHEAQKYSVQGSIRKGIGNGYSSSNVLTFENGKTLSMNNDHDNDLESVLRKHTQEYGYNDDENNITPSLNSNAIVDQNKSNEIATSLHAKDTEELKTLNEEMKNTSTDDIKYRELKTKYDLALYRFRRTSVSDNMSEYVDNSSERPIVTLPQTKDLDSESLERTSRIMREGFAAGKEAYILPAPKYPNSNIHNEASIRSEMINNTQKYYIQSGSRRTVPKEDLNEVLRTASKSYGYNSDEDLNSSQGTSSRNNDYNKLQGEISMMETNAKKLISEGKLQEADDIYTDLGKKRIQSARMRVSANSSVPDYDSKIASAEKRLEKARSEGNFSDTSKILGELDSLRVDRLRSKNK